MISQYKPSKVFFGIILGLPCTFFDYLCFSDLWLTSQHYQLVGYTANVISGVLTAGIVVGVSVLYIQIIIFITTKIHAMRISQFYRVAGGMACIADNKSSKTNNNLHRVDILMIQGADYCFFHAVMSVKTAEWLPFVISQSLYLQYQIRLFIITGFAELPVNRYWFRTGSTGVHIACLKIWLWVSPEIHTVCPF